MSGEEVKRLYEQLDATYAALGELHRPDWVDLVRQLYALTNGSPAERAVRRWLDLHNDD